MASMTRPDKEQRPTAERLGAEQTTGQDVPNRVPETPRHMPHMRRWTRDLGGECPMTTPTEQLTELLARILATDRPDYETGWVDGYRAGYDAGHDVGHGRAHVELDEQWRAIAARAVRVGTSRPLGELQTLRDQPSGALWEARNGEGRAAA